MKFAFCSVIFPFCRVSDSCVSIIFFFVVPAFDDVLFSQQLLLERIFLARRRLATYRRRLATYRRRLATYRRRLATYRRRL
jgi:hypothetical protein